MNFVSARLFSYDGITVKHNLSAMSSMQWLDALEETGSFQFTIPIEYVPNITIGDVVKIAYGDASDDYVFAGVVENLTLEQLGSGSDGIAQVSRVSGRGAAAILEDALVFTDGGGDPDVRTFTSTNVGAIMDELIDEAQTRGVLTYLTYNFTNLLDSNGNAYSETGITIQEQVGTNLLAVAEKHQEVAIDYFIHPDGGAGDALQLRYLNSRGTDLSTGANPIVLRVGQNVLQLADQRSGPVRNFVYINTGSGYSTQEDAGSVSAYGRRETFLSMTNNTDATLQGLSATHILNQQSNPTDGTTIQLAEEGPVPYIDFGVGDTVLLARIDGTRTAYRVRSISATVDDAGGVTFVPELGTARADLTRRLNAALLRAERQNAADSVVADLPGGGGGGGVGGAEIFNGEVLTYNENTDDGTVDVDGNTINFNNTTGFGLGVGDIVVLTNTSGIVDPIAIAIFDRVGSYTPTVLNNPQAVAGFPFDGDALPNQLNYVLFNVGFTSVNPLNPGTAGSPVVAHFGTGILGYAGRVIIYLSRTSSSAGSFSARQPPIVFYDVETGSSTALNRTHAVSASSTTTDIGVIGTRLFITYDGTTGACVESFESSTGVFSTHDIQRAVFLGVSNSRAWFVGKVSGALNPTRWKVISIDASGTLSSIDNPGNVTSGTQIFGRAKNGQLYFRIDTSGALLHTASTSVAASSLTFTSTTAPATLPYSTTGNLGTVIDGNRARASSDIDSNGDCYFFVRTGTPTTAGFAVINKTALTVTTFTQQTSSLGTAAAGEILMHAGLCLVGSTVVLAGAIREDLVSGGTRTGSCVPAFWRTDGVTINRTDFTSYVGASGGTGTGSQGFARATVIHTDSVTNTFFLHTNIGAQNSGTVSTSNAAGPAFGEAFTV